MPWPANSLYHRPAYLLFGVGDSPVFGRYFLIFRFESRSPVFDTLKIDESEGITLLLPIYLNFWNVIPQAVLTHFGELDETALSQLPGKQKWA